MLDVCSWIYRFYGIDEEGKGIICTYFSNSVSVFVSAASTLAQFPCGHVILVPVELLFPPQYAAALYWAKNSSWSRTLASMAAFHVSARCLAVTYSQVEDGWGLKRNVYSIERDA
jgi:hypothetical protein